MGRPPGSREEGLEHQREPRGLWAAMLAITNCMPQAMVAGKHVPTQCFLKLNYLHLKIQIFFSFFNVQISGFLYKFGNSNNVGPTSPRGGFGPEGLDTWSPIDI